MARKKGEATASEARLQSLLQMLQKVQREVEVEHLEVDTLETKNDIYPRLSIDMERVALMADALTDGLTLPPILVAADRKQVVDGWHRLLAHRQVGARLIAAKVLPVSDTVDLLVLGAVTNTPVTSLPLRRQDVARTLLRVVEGLGGTVEAVLEWAGSLDSLAGALGVSVRAVRAALERVKNPEASTALAGGPRRKGETFVPPWMRPQDAQASKSPKRPPEAESGTWGLQQPPTGPAGEVSIQTYPAIEGPWQTVFRLVVALVRAFEEASAVTAGGRAESLADALKAMDAQAQVQVGEAFGRLVDIEAAFSEASRAVGLVV
jgi:ParB-like chromosome segregation protein Spo0J